MADETFIYIGAYPDEESAQVDYAAVKQLHSDGIVGSYDAAVVTKDERGKIHANKDETATRHGAWWGIAAGAALGAIFPPSILGTAAVGGVIGGVSGHLAKGMSRSRVKELGELIEPGQAGLVVVGETRIEDAVQHAAERASRSTTEELSVSSKDLDRVMQETMKDM